MLNELFIVYDSIAVHVRFQGQCQYLLVVQAEVHLFQTFVVFFKLESPICISVILFEHPVSLYWVKVLEQRRLWLLFWIEIAQVFILVSD
jgi:hypothetical protein